MTTRGNATVDAAQAFGNNESPRNKSNNDSRKNLLPPALAWAASSPKGCDTENANNNENNDSDNASRKRRREHQQSSRRLETLCLHQKGGITAEEILRVLKPLSCGQEIIVKWSWRSGGGDDVETDTGVLGELVADRRRIYYDTLGAQWLPPENADVDIHSIELIQRVTQQGNAPPTVRSIREITSCEIIIYADGGCEPRVRGGSIQRLAWRNRNISRRKMFSHIDKQPM
jgi:hypothetical protein